MRIRSYVIVTSPGRPLRGSRPHHHGPGGRHRLGTPGRVHRHPGRSRRPSARGHHRAVVRRRTGKPSALAARYGAMTVLLGVVLISGWFAASGAAAFAQMIQP